MTSQDWVVVERSSDAADRRRRRRHVLWAPPPVFTRRAAKKPAQTSSTRAETTLSANSRPSWRSTERRQHRRKKHIWATLETFKTRLDASVLQRFEAAYVKCVKMLTYLVLHEETVSLQCFYELRLPTFETIVHSAKVLKLKWRVSWKCIQMYLLDVHVLLCV